jgi:putative ABC transport system permease protein
MSLWRQITRGLRSLTRSQAAAGEVTEELQHYFDEAVADATRRGLTPEAARRAAQAECGNLTSHQEAVHTAAWEHGVEATFADLRYAWRGLRSNPGFTAVTVLTLAIGIGAATAIFSTVNAILFEPLPYPHPERLLMISDVGVGRSLSMPTFGTYEELADRSQSFAALAATNAWRPALSGSGVPERVDALQVSAPYFRVWAVSPTAGRDFEGSEDVPNGPHVAILSSSLAERRFGRAHAALGQVVRLDGDPYTVVGVMPAGFQTALAPSTELWVALQYHSHAAPQTKEWGHHLHIIGRLKAGVSDARARAELQAIARTRTAEFPRPSWAALQDGLIVHGLQQDVVGNARPALLAILGAVLLVLAIAAVNVTNLLLARGLRRRGEFAMRVALGAARRRLVRQLLTESLLVAGVGGALALGLAAIGVRLIIALSPPGLPRADAIRMDGPAFAFAFAVTALAGIAIGLAPAASATQRDLHSALHEGSRRVGSTTQATRRGLVVAEVALALVLLVSAGLLVRSLARLLSVPPGFDPSGVITMQVEAAGHQYDAGDATYRFFTEALDAVDRTPGVAAAAFTSQVPLSGQGDGYGFTLESVPADTLNAFRYVVTPGYLSVMHIPVMRGRSFEAQDVRGAPEVMLISQSLAKREFAGVDPVGQHIKAGPALSDGTQPWATIVGVVADVRQDSLALSDANAFYMPMGQWSWVDNVQSLVVRTASDPASLAPALERAIWSVDKDQPITRVTTLSTLVNASTADHRFVLELFAGFAGVALLLAGIGIYGILSGVVAERTREIGVRSALGASRTAILALVGRQGMALAAFGIAIGLAGALLASRAIAVLLFGVTPLDPITYLSMIGVLALVSGLACWLPAWRATRVDPAITLRLE